jgi:hypothetical protein
MFGHPERVPPKIAFPIDLQPLAERVEYGMTLAVKTVGHEEPRAPRCVSMTLIIFLYSSRKRQDPF